MTTRTTITPFKRTKNDAGVPACPSPPHHWIIDAKDFGVCVHGCHYQFPYNDQDSFTERNSRIFLPSVSVRLPYS
mgnify:CR=1 FL=1